MTREEKTFRKRMSYERFNQLLLKNGIKPNKVSRDTGIAASTLSDWKNGLYVPKMDKLITLAEYFGVSLEYFIAKEERQ